ncbi:phosphohydrolase [Desulfuribacillus stibiiarsenatis]|uniref:Phosphohydrolase n=1 Tax=Desulfuribacillus stibiiarsenatis TaxID=1390249 RepID=A0A1E5L6S5_9FIRM|nr:HD domain-containing phosphohydrolase [Desulfuribacillus stibiiarsenatis]OEH85679.1 phosphohydrolase [Desulfuribacillus stibiiarsenatis]
MKRELRVSLFDLVTSLSNAMDLVSQDIVNHHKRVAYIALKIAEEMNLRVKDINNIVLAGILHDVGALSFRERLFAREYEFSNGNLHAEVGYQLLKDFAPMQKMAQMVRFHHLPWKDGAGQSFEGEEVPIGGHILHLADRVEILINRREEILGQTENIVSIIQKGDSTLYCPSVVDAFCGLADKEYFWLDIVSPNIEQILSQSTEISSIELDLMDILDFTRMFSQIIDYRSSFTATHSSGVGATAEAIARLIGLSERECKKMRIAGNLHDLGKLAIPKEILEKPDKLQVNEFNVIRSHTYHTYRVLDAIPGFREITEWAAYHHEKLDGTGYPFHIKGEDISLGARIMAVADIFTAITEDRPYRTGLEKEKVLTILKKKVEENALDERVVTVLENHYDEVNDIRFCAQSEAYADYQEFGKESAATKLDECTKTNE